MIKEQASGTPAPDILLGKFVMPLLTAADYQQGLNLLPARLLLFNLQHLLTGQMLYRKIILPVEYFPQECNVRPGRSLNTQMAYLYRNFKQTLKAGLAALQYPLNYQS